MTAGSSVLWTAALAVRLHRRSHACHSSGRHGLARLFWQLNLLLTGADIDPASRLGRGVRIPHPAGVTLAASAGERLVVGAMACIGPTAGAVRIGDGVVIEPHAVLRGPLTVGDGARIGAGAVVSGDVAPGACVPSEPTRTYRLRRAR